MKEEEVRAIFLLAGFGIESLYQLSNEYDRNPKDPWWLVKTEFGLIKVGWRKRVIQIDWEDTAYRNNGKQYFKGTLGRHLPPFLPTDIVTCEDTYVHAWGYSDAVSYIKTLHLRLIQLHGPKDV